MTAIAGFRTKVLAILDDASNTKFSNNQVDQAIRDALKDYSNAFPLERTYSYDCDGEDRIVLPADFVAMQVVRVELIPSGDSQDDLTKSNQLPFCANYSDEQWVIETPGRTIPIGRTVVIYYTGPHFIDGLDSAAGTTIPDTDDEIFSLGAAGYALLSRGVNRSEANVIESSTTDTLQALAQKYLTNFRGFLSGRDKGYVAATWDLDSDDHF
jgi:hypothetical protein